jgi:hypothetical protein
MKFRCRSMALKKARDFRRTVIPSAGGIQGRRLAMMGRQTSDQSQLFYLFNFERRIPAAIFCAGSIR